jgi:hypothetical protein
VAPRILTFGPKETLSPMMMREQSSIVVLQTQPSQYIWTIGRATSVVDLLEICIEVIPDTYIATVIDKNRWLKVDIGSNRTKKLAQDGLSVGSKFIWGRSIWYGGAIVL